jgi:hypothetical protein
MRLATLEVHDVLLLVEVGAGPGVGQFQYD